MFNVSSNTPLHPNQGHADDVLLVCGIPGRHENKHVRSQTDTHIWDAFVKLVCLQQQNPNWVVGYYSMRDGWKMSLLSGYQHIQLDQLSCTHGAKVHYANTCIPKHINTEKAWHWYQLGRKSLKCPSQALWSALTVIAWRPMRRWRNESEKRYEIKPC